MFPYTAVPKLRNLRRNGLATRSKCEAEGVASGDGGLSPLRTAVLNTPNNIGGKPPCCFHH
ncbi:hypothetical protein LHA01_12710 [Schleiferilactobacillus harbinensis]|nr:hypothetical protein LHA01_12710 [Schleiferilactobacillus harbinensis]